MYKSHYKAYWASFPVKIPIQPTEDIKVNAVRGTEIPFHSCNVTDLVKLA